MQSEPRFDTVALDICRPLGRGAFGEVFLVQVSRAKCENATTSQLPENSSYEFLALKRVSVAQLSDAGAAKALEEATLLKRLSEEHHAILRCFDFRITSDSSPHLELLLEFAPLGDLSCRIRSHRTAQVAQEAGLPEAEVISYGGDVAAGLAHLHQLRPKVFHRDIKPANVVLFYGQQVNGTSGVPRAKLADFGIAKVMESEGSFAGAATVIGTPHYFAPEICRGEGYDERADAWAFGCVLYEMMCLHRPFHKVESNLALLALRISEGKYDKDALQKQARNYNGLLIFILVGLLNLDIEQRSRASDVVQSLQDLQVVAPENKDPMEAWWLKDNTGNHAPAVQPNLQAVSENSDSWGGAVKPQTGEFSSTPTFSNKLATGHQRCREAELTGLPLDAAQAAGLEVLLQGEEEPITIMPGVFNSSEGGRSISSPTGYLSGGLRNDISGSLQSPSLQSKSEVNSCGFTFMGSRAPCSQQFTSEAPPTECLGEVFFGGSGTGREAAARLAWAGQPHRETSFPEDSHVEQETPSNSTSNRGEAEMHQQEGQSKRLFLRPLWPNAPNDDDVEAPPPPVLLRFASGSRERETPSSKNTVTESSQPPISRIPSPQGWMEVRFSQHGGEILVHGEADDHGIFSLTSLE